MRTHLMLTASAVALSLLFALTGCDSTATLDQTGARIAQEIAPERR